MIEYRKFVRDFLTANRLTAQALDGREVIDVYDGFRTSLPAGITISKRMFLKHLRTVVTVDTKPGYKYVKTGEYKTITKFVMIRQAKNLIQLGFTDHSTEEIAQFQLDGQVQFRADKSNGNMEIRTNGFVMNVEILDAIRKEAIKYEQED